MKFFKVLLALVALVILFWGASWLFGVAVALLKWVFVLGVIALAGVGAYRLLAGPDADARAELSPAEAERMLAERMLAEIRRKQLSE
ncbi:MAG TPA: hypothetical protein VF659_07685 [Pyrinomonadaceae bacterium]|jgi:hypothetical protein